MSEDREKCLAAGMDAHLGKPIEVAQVIEALSRFLKAPATAPAIDRGALKELTGGDREFERELAETFVSSGDQCLAEIIAALQASDFDTVRKRAHSLKGASANIHARELSLAASSLENAARENALPAISGLVSRTFGKARGRQRRTAPGRLIVRLAVRRHVQRPRASSWPLEQFRPASLLL